MSDTSSFGDRVEAYIRTQGSPYGHRWLAEIMALQPDDRVARYTEGHQAWLKHFAPRDLSHPQRLNRAALRAAVDKFSEFLADADGPTADGPLDKFRFKYCGRILDLSRQALRYRLLAALWDNARHAPRPSRQVDAVMEELWPDDDAADRALADLCYRVRLSLDRAGMLLTVITAGGQIWLAPRI